LSFSNQEKNTQEKERKENELRAQIVGEAEEFKKAFYGKTSATCLAEYFLNLEWLIEGLVNR
jgi:hypothetical protein